MKTSKTAGTFADMLHPRTEEEAEADRPQSAEDMETGLAEALDNVHIQGERLKKKPGFETIAEYKKAVRRFLKLISDACYELEEKVSIRRETENRKTQIRIIDEKLEKLAAQIMHSQKSEFEILGRVDEIYGLLIDLRQ
jgi:uncharacterized protein YaaR (DUF327 family)